MQDVEAAGLVQIRGRVQGEGARGPGAAVPAGAQVAALDDPVRHPAPDFVCLAEFEESDLFLPAQAALDDVRGRARRHEEQCGGAHSERQPVPSAMREGCFCTHPPVYLARAVSRLLLD